MKNVFEIVVIGNQKYEAEKLFTILSDSPVRNFQGMNFGALELKNNKIIHFYFLNQENESYFYLWDLIIPHAMATLVVCDCNFTQHLGETLRVIKRLEERFKTPYFLCAINDSYNLAQEIKKNTTFKLTKDQIINFDSNSKESAKGVLLSILSLAAKS